MGRLARVAEWGVSIVVEQGGGLTEGLMIVEQALTVLWLVHPWKLGNFPFKNFGFVRFSSVHFR